MLLRGLVPDFRADEGYGYGDGDGYDEDVVTP